MNKRVYIEHGNWQYQALFQSLGFTIVFSPEAADIICFTGGSDVTPSLYGEVNHKTTFNDPNRDEREIKLFDYAQAHKIPCVGICRGGQFLNVMSGGKMFQDVEKHCYAHNLTDLVTGEVIYVSSTHHQMMRPTEDAIIIATSVLGGRREWMEGHVVKRDISKEDYEVVFYERTNCLCFQPHPEFVGSEYIRMSSWFATLLNRYFGV
jgi:anthranilate/para-aminobenzoate synthase component II